MAHLRTLGLTAAALLLLANQPLRAEALQGGQALAAATAGAPVMGSGTYRPLPQFSRDGAAAATPESAATAAARALGLPLGLDDHGSTPATATALAEAGSGAAAATAYGVVEASGDRDVFVIRAGAGPLAAGLVTATPEGGADLVLSLRDGAGRLVPAASPGRAPGPQLAYRIAEAGTYYLEVTAPAGASGGHFRLRASYPPAAATAPQSEPAL